MTTVSGPVRVRFAPSPTGYLHVGGARTAIYNDLLRHAVGGVFLLRIEDTDQKRSDAAMVEQIQTAMAWLGIESDEGPHLQSHGLERHAEAARRLLAEGRAYRDFATAEETEALRKRAQADGFPLREAALRSAVGEEEWSRREAAALPSPIRFRQGSEVRIDDLVRGEVVFAPAVLDDFIILRSDGTPTYHLSVVCDDVDMGITHVIRGEDHLSNTPKHIPLFEALGAEVPRFAHLPLILGEDRKRLSKRTGAASVEEFRDQGILASALYNYLALLGWSPGDDREIFLDRDELVAAFGVERLLGSASVFDTDKLAWVNAQHMSGQPLSTVLEALPPFLSGVGLSDGIDAERLSAAAELHRSRAKTLRDLASMVAPHFQDRLEYEDEPCRRFLATEGIEAHLETLADRLSALEAWGHDGIEGAIRGLAEEAGVKAGILIHPTRMALSGSKKGPSLFELVEVVGPEASARHLRHLAAFLRGLSRG